MRRFSFLLWLLATAAVKTAPACAMTPADTWQAAGTAYINGDYPKAVELYEGVVAEGLRSPHLYYNLGNAYFKSNQMARAILNYRRALRLSPTDADARYNLRVAESMTQDKIERVPEFFLSAWLTALRVRLNAASWAVCSLLALILSLSAVLFHLLSRRVLLRRAGFWVALGGFALFACSVGFALQNQHETIAQTDAIIMEAAVPIRSAPAAGGKELFILHEGASVQITARLGEWCEIVIADGKRGWIAASQMETV